MTPLAGCDSGTIKVIGSEVADLPDMLIGEAGCGKSTRGSANGYCCNEV
jgi:hypothetical protein